MAYRAVYFLTIACLSCTAAQLADNLIVSGSNRPFAEGVGTYGLPKRGEGGLVSDKMPSVMVTDRASGALFSNGSGNVTRYNSTADALAALASFLGSDVSRQLSGGRRLAQQPAAKLNTSDIVTTGCAHSVALGWLSGPVCFLVLTSSTCFCRRMMNPSRLSPQGTRLVAGTRPSNFLGLQNWLCNYA